MFIRRTIRVDIIRTVAMLLTLVFVVSSADACGLLNFGEADASPSPTRTDAPKADTGVIINEVVSSNSRTHEDPVYGKADWVELYNPSSEAADISGAKLGDSPAMQKALVFPEGTVIAPGGFLTVLCVADASTDGDTLTAPFGVSRSGEKIYFETVNGVMALCEVPMLPTDFSYARADDGSWGYSPTPTFGGPNANVFPALEEAESGAVHADALRFSELVSGPEGWVELVNASAEAAELSSYYLTDDEGDPMKWRFPEMELGAGELVIVELNELHPEALSASFKVSRTENAIYLYNDLLDKVDALEFAIPVPDGISVVAGENGPVYTSFITKAEPNSDRTFAALEWKAMDTCAPETRLYINEVLASIKYSMIDSRGDRSDWVELHNPSEYPAYLEGYYLSDDPEEPLKWQLPNVSLLPGGYLIVFLSGNEMDGAEMHASFSLSNGESIVLSKLDGMEQDIVTIPEDLPSNISIGRNAEGELRYYAAPTPNGPNSTHALERYAEAGFDPASLYISEVSAVSPARSGGNDWIELYNGSDSGMSLSGWRLTDNIDEPDKFVFGSTSISAGGYAVVTCSDTAKSGSGKAPFSISNTGDTIFLIDPDGAVRDVFSTGVTSVGCTSGRAHGSPDGARCFFTSATRGGKNGSPLSGVAAEPVFSRAELYCSSAFELEITCPTQDATIRYTTDGSNPNSSSKEYTGPIRVSKSTVIKAAAFREGLVKSPVAVRTYIFADEHTLPVVSLSLSASDYGRMYTASINEKGGVTHGDEVACYMEYYVDGRLAISSGAGVRVSGASTSVYAQKSLGLYFRSGYGRSSLDYPLFEGCEAHSFRSLVLRNAGQDAAYARMRDAYMSRICQGLDIDVAYVRPVIVYVNGDYRGVYDLKENLNEDYLVSHYGIERNSAEIATRNGRMLAGTKTQWNQMRSLCQTLDFSKQENFDKLAKIIDTDCVIDYLIARTYFYDGDMFNQKYWHTNDSAIRWRPVFFDSDYAMMGNSVGGNILGLYFNPNGFTTFHGYNVNMDIFCALNQNRAWRDKFITRYIYVVKHVFNKENALEKFDELVAEYKPEMRRHTARWHMPSSYDKWQEEVAAFRSCVARRPDYALKNLKNFYHLSDAQFEAYERAARGN